MNDKLTNQLDMIGTVLNVSDLPENKAVWQGHPPLDFTTDLTALRADYGGTAALATQLATAATGPADAKDAAESVTETLCFQLCRALANHFKKTGDLANRAKVAVRIGAIQKLRDQGLVDFSTAVATLATTASSDPDAANRGITPARIAALTGATATFNGLKNSPRGTIVNQSTLRRELETRVAALVEAVTDMDDLVLQFDGNEAAHRFQTAWTAARQVIDHSHRTEPTPATTTTSTPPPTA